jgi:putative acetyltransferase
MDVQKLLSEHLADMYATSPPESVHALDHESLSGPGMTFWTARQDSEVLGCCALKQLDTGPGKEKQGEIKSMRTAAHARGRGVATGLLEHLLAEARRGGYEQLFLETGSQEFFAPARRLYQRHGFIDCPPFGTYVPDPNSIFMTRVLP